MYIIILVTQNCVYHTLKGIFVKGHTDTVISSVQGPIGEQGSPGIPGPFGPRVSMMFRV